MYLAPINYDRFFERVFRDLKIAKQFLEDLLDVTIDTIELLPRKNKITDDAAFVEFDFRCKINEKYVIVDMQQWYKQDVVKRFFMYFCNNTSLQLENIPVMSIPTPNSKSKFYKTKNYNKLNPSITIIWMADDVLGFVNEVIGYSMFPEILHDFIRDEALWVTKNIVNLLEQRKKILEILDNNTKGLAFLRENRLIYAFQPNIVKSKALYMNKYRIWFDFAEKTKNKENKESDFESFKNIPVFMDIMEKLRTTTLSQDDFQYITDQAEYERGLAVYNEKVREEAREEVWNEALLKYEPMILMLEHAEQETRKLEKQKQKIEAEKQKAEVEKQKAEHTLLLMIRKFLKKGDSVEDIAEFLELDMPTLERFLEQIKKDDTINDDSKNT